MVHIADLRLESLLKNSLRLLSCKIDGKTKKKHAIIKYKTHLNVERINGMDGEMSDATKNLEPGEK